MSQSSLLSPELRKLKNLDHELANLAEHPSWSSLVKMFEAEKTEWALGIGNKLLAGGLKAAPIDQRELDYKRGYFAGIRAVLSAPETVSTQVDARERKEGNV